MKIREKQQQYAQLKESKQKTAGGLLNLDPSHEMGTTTKFEKYSRLGQPLFSQ